MFKCELILSLLKTTPEQPNPFEAARQRHHLIHHKVELHRYLCTLQAVWITVARARPQMSFLMFRGCSGGLILIWLTCHIVIVFAGDLIHLRCTFRGTVCLHKTWVRALPINWSIPTSSTSHPSSFWVGARSWDVWTEVSPDQTSSAEDHEVWSGSTLLQKVKGHFTSLSPSTPDGLSSFMRGTEKVTKGRSPGRDLFSAISVKQRRSTERKHRARWRWTAMCFLVKAVHHPHSSPVSLLRISGPHSKQQAHLKRAKSWNVDSHFAKKAIKFHVLDSD